MSGSTFSAMTPAPRSLATRALGVLVVVALQGCGFFESVGEITLGKGQLPRITQEFDWPAVDTMTGSAIAKRLTDSKGKPVVTGAPTSLKAATLAHVQGIMALAGDCQREFTQAKVSDDPKAGVSNLAVRITNCSGDERCRYLCGDFRGMELEAGVEMQLLNEAQAKDLAKQLRQGSPEAAIEAIVQIRLRFFQLELYQRIADDEREVVNDKLSRFDLILTEPGAHRSVAEILAMEKQRDAAREAARASGEPFDPDPWADLPSWVKLLDERHLPSISPQTPQRFELDGRSKLMRDIKETLVAGDRTALRLVQRIRVKRPDLYELRFDGAGMAVDAQPEMVVSVLQLVKNLGAGGGGK